MSSDSTAVRLITELKNARSEEARGRAARRLREWVRVESSGGTDAAFSATMNTLNNRIFELVNSPDPNDKMSGIIAIYELTEEPVPDNETKIVKFANYLRGVPVGATDPAVLKLSAKALGHLARTGGTVTADFVEYEAKRALDWLQNDTKVQDKKLACVLILRELAENAPTLFYPQLSTFFGFIWVALTDGRQFVRESAARALCSCLTLVTKRYSKGRDQWFVMLYNTARATLTGGGTLPASVSSSGTAAARSFNDIIHGALLTMGELLNNELVHEVMLAAHEKLLLPKFNELCEMVLKYRDSKEKLVRRTVIVLLPRLAYYNPEGFVRGYAEVALAHLLACLRDPKQIQDRGTAFVVVGRISLAVGGHLSADALRPQLERIVVVLRETLGTGVPPTAPSARAPKRPFVQESLNCIGMLAKAVGPVLMEFMYDLLDPMFSDGLSPMLMEALQCVSTNIPAIRPLLQERLLHEVSLVLANRPFVPPYADPAAMFRLHQSSYGDGAGSEYGVSLGAPLSSVGGVTAQNAGNTILVDAPWTGYSLLSNSTLAALSARYSASTSGTASVGALPANNDHAIAALVSVAAHNAASNGIVQVGQASMFGGNAAFSVSVPSVMSWARNLPSSLTGGTDGSGTSGSGVPPSTTSAGGLPGAGDGNLPIILANARGIPKDLISLTLHVLGTFDFKGIPLLPFVREVVMMYLDDDDPIIRLEAGLTCCRLMVRPTDLMGKDFDSFLATSGLDQGDAGDPDDFDSDDEDEEADDDSGDLASLPKLRNQAEIVRRRKLHAMHRAFVAKLKPPQHPLLIYGNDMAAVGVGMGEYTSPVSAASLNWLQPDPQKSTTLDHALGALLGVVGVGPTYAIVSQVLERILVAAVTDTDPAIRFELLSSLDRRFDALLIEDDNLRLLFHALQDENYACREAALALVGRLTGYNPAAILPAMRESLLSLLSELEYADAHPDISVTSKAAMLMRLENARSSSRWMDVGRSVKAQPGSGITSNVSAAARLAAYHNGSSIILHTMKAGGGRDHAARMLGLLIRGAQRLVAPYVPVILRALLPHGWRAARSNPLLASDVQLSMSSKPQQVFGMNSMDLLTTSVLAAIGELSAVGADHILPYVNIIIPLVVDAVSQGAHLLGIGPSVANSHSSLGGVDTSSATSNLFNASSLSAAHPAIFTEVAIRTLGLLVGNTGHVIIPYLDHPRLMQILITLVARGPISVSSTRSTTRSGRSGERGGLTQPVMLNSFWSLRREAMRAIGILGALDPYRHRMAQVAQAQRSAGAVQQTVQSKLASSVTAARAKGRRLAAAGLAGDVLHTGMRPGAGAQTNIDQLDGKEFPLILKSGTADSSAWELQENLPTIIGVAVGGGMDIDPLEAAMAGLAGEPGANVGINLDEVGVGLGITGNAGMGAGIGMDGILQAGPGGGIIALDSDSTTQAELQKATDGDQSAALANVAASAILPSMVNPTEDFYPTVALAALLAILSDDALALQHSASLQAIMLILRSLGSRCVGFLPRVVPTFLNVLRVSAAKARTQPPTAGRAGASTSTDGVTGIATSAAGDAATSSSVMMAIDTNASLRDTVLQQLAALVGLVKQHMRPWLPGIFALVRDVWPASLPSLLRLIETVAAALGEECKPYIASIIPHFLSVLAHDGTRPVYSPLASIHSIDAPALAPVNLDGGSAAATVQPSRTNTRHVLHTLTVLVCGGRRALWGGHRHLIDDHLDLLVPAICRLVDAGVSLSSLDDDASTSNITGHAATSSLGWWTSASGIPSNSSSLNGYGHVSAVVRRQAIDTLAAMAASGVNLIRFAARIVHPIGRALADSSGYTTLEIKRAGVDLLCLLALQVREDFIIWVPTIRKACMLATLGSTSGDGVPNAVGIASSGSTTSGALGDHFENLRSGGAASVGIGTGGVSGTGAGSVIRHETYERLVALLLGFGAGYGYLGDDSMALYGYGPPLSLPTNPVDLAELLYDPGTCGADGSGVRIASALALNNLGSMLSVTTPVFGGSVLDGCGGTGGPLNGVPGLLGPIATENETFGTSLVLPNTNINLTAVGSEGLKKLPVNHDSVKRAWETNSRSTKEDWAEWMRRFSFELLRESPSPALRSCCSLAQVYAPLASDLFNAAFVAIWTELYDENQDSLMGALEAAFTSETIPTSILQSLLNLAEFMEHDEKPLPIDVRLLGQLAEKVGAFAKALHYKEMQFHTDPGSCIEAIISINNQLDQPEAAVGILKYAQQKAHGYGQYGYRASHMVGMTPDGTTGAAAQADRNALFAFGGGLDIQETWYEKLGRWEDALEAYERKQAENPNSLNLILGRMRCLKAIGEWQRLEAVSREVWPRLVGHDLAQRAVAPLAARAAWALGRWEEMEAYVNKTDELSMQGSFFRAVLEIHRLQFDAATRFIDRARRVLCSEFAAMGNESYGRAYRKVVTLQQLSEMEEILTYLRLQEAGNAPGASTYISHVRNMWSSRLRGCGKNVDVWNRILSVRSLVVVASENMSEWLQFASLCRRSGRMNMALKVLMGLGMDGGGGLTESLARYLSGQGSIHGYDTTRAGTTPLVTPLGRASANGGSVDPMLLPDHPYKPFDYNDPSDNRQMLEASSKVGIESAAHPRVVYAYLKYLWHAGRKEEAVDQLRTLVDMLDVYTARRDGKSGLDADGFVYFGKHKLSQAEQQSLRVQCYLRLGQWQEAMVEPVVSSYGGAYTHVSMRKTGSPSSKEQDGFSNRVPKQHPRTFSVGDSLTGSVPYGSSRTSTRMPSNSYADLIAPIMKAFKTATHDCGEAGYTHYRAWHSWAIMNFTAAEYHAENARAERDKERQRPSSGTSGSTTVRESRRSVTKEKLSPVLSATLPPAGAPASAYIIHNAVVAHATAAVKGFFRSIALGRTRLKAYVLQDLLRLLTLWFNHGDAAPVRTAIEAGLGSGAISIEVWLQVIPQLIARINIRTPAVHKLLQSLLNQIGQVHPQALVYPLTVACKSSSDDRRSAATAILSQMRRRWSKLVDQAEMVSRELIRVAISWHELWHSGLDEASRQYFGDGNVAGMLSTLLPLHEMMYNPGPQTVKEAAFAHAFRDNLDQAYKWLLAYQRTGETGDLSQAWEVYLRVFKNINKALPNMMSLDLPSVSPILLSAHDLELSVPGTYHAGSPVVTIMAFSPSIEILSSKQRPRKVTLLGSNGRQYTFLLKGHEDLRQDERVMQLFGLVNTLLANDPETSRRDLSIRRYAVTPLSHDAGVVGWVPFCDTLHALTREYRDSKKILLNIEHRLMVQMAPMYDSLTALQKVEVFRYALDNTTGQDLYKVLWLKSTSSEVWLERRTNYTRSLAVMSIVGYILGLGDRHPSNLMLDRASGKILHIDFGDCFEVAMTREKIPERVPFRLTRMLVNAMEVSGIEGNYRSVCEAVMRVLRFHRDSVMAMLEAFVHDPLINWRLLNTTTDTERGIVNTSATPAASAAKSRETAAPPAPKLSENDEIARTLRQQGLDFAAEAEAAVVATAMANTGLTENSEAGAGAGQADAKSSAVMARSLAVSLHTGRGDRERELMQSLGPEGAAAPTEAVNERAMTVIRRVQAKLTGRDFAEDDPIGRMMSMGVGLSGGLGPMSSPDASGTLDASAQVQRLICAATSHENLSQCYIGWCPFW